MDTSARKDAQPVARVVRKGCSTGSLFYTEHGQLADLPDGTLLYTHPAPDALRVAVEALKKVSSLTDKDVSAKGLLGVVELLVEIQTTARQALAALQAEQKGGGA